MALESSERTWPAEPASAPCYRWYHKVFAVLFSLFCFEIGAFLFCFPWLEIWSQNYFANLGPAWSELWFNPYFRGAVSGLGLIDIGIALAEVFRLRRFSGSAGALK
jgi:hypothetical protein